MPNKIIEVGKFYFIHDGSKSGHPGFVIWKDDERNLYLAIKFGTSPNEHNFPFVHPVGENTDKSYVYKRAFLGKRKDYIKRSLPDMKISESESNVLLTKIDLLNPVFSTNINRKDRKYYRWIMKQTIKNPL